MKRVILNGNRVDLYPFFPHSLNVLYEILGVGVVELRQKGPADGEPEVADADITLTGAEELL